MGGLGPSGIFGISERDWLSNYGVLKIEGFGGRPPVGGRPGAQGPPPPSKSGPEQPSLTLSSDWDLVNFDLQVLQKLSIFLPSSASCKLL